MDSYCSGRRSGSVGNIISRWRGRKKRNGWRRRGDRRAILLGTEEADSFDTIRAPSIVLLHPISGEKIVSYELAI